jgi:hypothetical protein
MLSAELHPCARPGCRRSTLWRYCAAHETDADRAARDTANRAAVDYALARERWLAALNSDEPVDVVESTHVMRLAYARRDETERAAGLVQR